MASFRPKLQILGLLAPNKNKYNPFLRQQPWHHARSVSYLKKNTNDCYDEDKKSILTLSKDFEYYGPRRKLHFLNFRRGASKEKPTANCKEQKSAEQKLTLWEYVFGPDPKRSWPDPCTNQLARTETRRRKNSRLYQATAGNVLIYTEPIRSSRKSSSVEPRPKPPPHKVPKAVLLNSMMVNGFEKDDNREDDGVTVTPTASRKPYEEMKPPLNTKAIVNHRGNVRSKNIEPYQESVSRQASTQINVTEARDSTTKILRQAMAQETRMHSRLQQLKILVNEKTKSQRASLLSRVKRER